ncbi:TonB-dependent receptor [Catenovulum sediminis]|uniref:TonB-dependent receptor n=1 Tax=Catenovulum sediminis TaxID=1740262 RepID=UPI00117FD71E|nr:TonB-dependent receptor [Catenovulum sediminis]
MKAEYLGVVAVGFLLSGYVTTTQAQEIETIQVTAQRKLQNIQTTPLAVSALNAEKLNQFQVEDLSDIETRIPGMSMGTLNGVQPQIFIRGIGSNDDSAGGDSSVAIFIDDVYINRAAGVQFNAFDMQRIEVLRGPQGTLYGKNGVGGVIHFIRNKPSQDEEAKITAGVGNLQHRQLNALLNTSLNKNLASRSTVSIHKRDGYVKGVEDAVQFSDVDNQAANLQLTYQTGEHQLNLAFDYYDEAQNSIGHRPLGGSIGQLIKLSQGEKANDFYRNFSSAPGWQKRTLQSLSLSYDTQLNWAELTSITAYRDIDANVQDKVSSTDIQYTELLDVNNQINEQATQFSQELRLSGEPLLQGKLNWLSGLYYLNADTKRNESFISDMGYLILSTPQQPVPPGTRLQLISQAEQVVETNSYAAYGQINYQLNDTHTWTTGLRISYEQKQATQHAPQADGLIVFEPYQASAEKGFNNHSWETMLESQWQDKLYSYVRYAQGFKSGGFQGTSPSKAAAEKPFFPETADNYEMGVRSDWFENQLRLNATAFLTEYKNLQVLRQQDAQTTIAPIIIVNAAKAQSKGLELDWIFKPAILQQKNQQVELSGYLAYLDAEYKEYENAGNSLAGNRLRNAPKNSYAVQLSWYLNLIQAGRVSTHIEYRYKGKTYQEPENLEASAIPAYHLTNAKVKYRSTNEKWFAEIWIDNLFDKQYYIHNFASPTSTGQLAVIGTPGLPRHYGINIGYTW